MRQTSFLIGRLLAGGYYLMSAFHHFTGVGALARHVGALGFPLPEVAVVLSGILLTIAGFTILLGIYPEIGVASLVLFLIPVTLTMHAFWADHDPLMRQMDLINFTKNVALLGSSLMFLGVARPWPYSVEQHTHLPVRAPL
jgi:putative oxidoreductase